MITLTLLLANHQNRAAEYTSKTNPPKINPVLTLSTSIKNPKEIARMALIRDMTKNMSHKSQY